MNFVIASHKYRKINPGMQSNGRGRSGMISIIRQKGVASVKDRISLGTKVLMVAVFFLYCLTPLFGSALGEALQNQEKPKAPLAEPETTERLKPVTVEPGTFPFLTDISVTPGDTFVDIKWTPYWQEELGKPSRAREFTRLLERRLEEALLLREKAMLEQEVEEAKLTEEREEERARLRSETLEAIPEAKEISGYIIHYGRESRNYTDKVDVGNVTRYRLRELRNHTTYFFAIQAYTKIREFSDLSEEVTATPRPEEELMSVIERGFAEEEIPQVIPRRIKQFGYDFFLSKTASFTPLADAPVGPDYIIGPGDGFTITLWGRIEGTFSVNVDRSGEITLPKVGVIKVWGLTFTELKQAIDKQLSKYYSGFQMNITMDRLRTIRIFMVGEARNPGSYVLSSVSTAYRRLQKRSPNAPSSTIPIFSPMAVAIWALRPKNGFTMLSAAL